MSKSGKSSGGPRLGGQFAPGGGRVGKTGRHRKPKPNDPRAQSHAKKRGEAARAWSQKSAEFHAKAKTAKTPLERRAYLTAAKKASAKAGEHAKEAASFVGKKHKIARGAQSHADKSSARDKKRAEHDSAKEQRSSARQRVKDEHSAHRADIKGRKDAWKSEDKSTRASKKEDKAWDAKVSKYRAKAERMDEKQRAKKVAVEKKKAEFWEKKRKEFHDQAKSAKNPVERESFLKAAAVAGGNSGDAFAWVRALGQVGGSIKEIMIQTGGPS